MTFQRARSEEQREIRRRAILDTASAMLDEMPVAEVTLNELSRRVGLAKSNVLRYFESREAVLLELLDRLPAGAGWRSWPASWPPASTRSAAHGRAGGSRWPRSSAARSPAEWCCATSSARRAGSWSTTSRSRWSARTSGPPWAASRSWPTSIRRHLPELGDGARTVLPDEPWSWRGALSVLRPAAAQPPRRLCGRARRSACSTRWTCRTALRVAFTSALVGMLPRS